MIQTPMPSFPTPAAARFPEWLAPFLAVVLLIVVGGLLLMPLVRAWARRIEGRGQDVITADELSQLRERVAELEMGGQHIAELEERLDFAERLLSQRPDRINLPMENTPV